MKDKDGDIFPNRKKRIFKGTVGTTGLINLSEDISKYSQIIVITGTSTQEFTGSLTGTLGFGDDIYCNKIWSNGDSVSSAQIHFLALKIVNNKQLRVTSSFYWALNSANVNTAFVREIYGII